MRLLEGLGRLYMAALWLMLGVLSLAVGLLTWPLWIDGRTGKE